MSRTSPLEGEAGRRLVWRIRIFGAGAVLGLAGIFSEESWLVTAALVVLLGGMGVRFVLDRKGPDGEDHPTA